MRKTTIIIIDDDPGIAEMVRDLFTLNGYPVISIDKVNDSKMIEELVVKHLPAVILLDLWMPGISGEELTKALKSNNLTSKVPVIIVSAHRETAQIAQTIGADSYLSKPFNLVDLEDLIAKYAVE